MRENNKSLSMEVPGQDNPLLFSQMLQLFPNIPHNVIQMYTLQYANDAEMCTQALNALNNKYKGKGDEVCKQDSLNEDMNLNQHVKRSKTDNVVPDELRSESKDSCTLEILVNGLSDLNINSSKIDENFNNDVKKPIDCIDNLKNGQFSNVNDQMYSSHTPTNCKNKENKFYSNINNVAQGDELHINIDHEEENGHSWRPNMSVNPLGSDLFLPQLAFNNHPAPESLASVQYPIPSYPSKPVLGNMENMNTQSQASNFSHQLYWEGVPNNYVMPVYYYHAENENSTQSDMQSHIYSQKALMNSIQYEVIKAKMEINKLSEEIDRLTQDLKLQLESREKMGIEKLNVENSKLRLECQCLYMELDYHENLLKNKKTQEKTEVENTPQNPTNDNVQDDFYEVEENKWGCSACTFENHPAINTCEICNSPRIRFQSQPPTFLSSVPNTCYCHPSEESLKMSS